MTNNNYDKRSLSGRAVRLCILGLLVALLAIVPSVQAEAADTADTFLVEEGESIQEAIDAAPPGTEFRISGAHEENVWINKNGITLIGLSGASITLPADPTATPCGFAVIVCAIPTAATDAFPGFPPEDAYLRDLRVQNLTLNAPDGTGVAAIFVDGANIRGNTMPGSAGGFVYVFTSLDVSVQHNEVVGPISADAVGVESSQGISIVGNSIGNALFSGISMTDSSNVRVKKNTVTGSCIGIAATNTGPGAADVSITHNEANENNGVCFPFGPGIPVGATGILAAGVDGLVIKHNTANDNVTDQFTITASGISVVDGPSGALSNDVAVSHNTAFGNISVSGPTDLSIETMGNVIKVKKNKCDFSTPSPNWCEG